MTHALSTSINEVDLASVAGLIEAIQGEPTRASTTWKADVTWKGAFRSESVIRDFGPIPSDEPAGLGGTDTAPNPVEQLLAALGNCLAVGYAANASAAGVTIHELRVSIEGDLDLHTFLGLAEGHAGFDRIRARVHLVTDASQPDVAALHQRVTSTSPVGHTLSNAVAVSIDLA
jgi:uncharacterized OsmC-like protein